MRLIPRNLTIKKSGMNAGMVELKFRDGTAVKIRGSADFVAAVARAILEVGKGKSGEHITVPITKPDRVSIRRNFIVSSESEAARLLRLSRRSRSRVLA